MQVERQDDLEISDNRVLGRGVFVERLRHEESLRDKMMSGMSLSELVGRVEAFFNLEKNSIKRRSNNQEVKAARDVYCYMAVRMLRYSGTHAGEILGIGRSAASHAVRRGERIIKDNDNLIGGIMAEI